MRIRITDTGDPRVSTLNKTSRERESASGEGRTVAITSREVAKLAGVSQATVSRVLHDHPGVHPEIRERVQRVLAQTQYQPNAMARAMKTSQTGSVGVVVARLSNPLYPALLQVIGAALARSKLRMVVWDSEHGGEQPASIALRQGIVDGVLLTTAKSDSPLLREAADARVPVVLVNRTVDGAACDQVSSDNVAGGASVARYLIACGRRRIAMIGGHGEASTIRDRERGFRQALEASGRPLDYANYAQVDTFSHETGRAAVQRLLELAHAPDAVFCTNDVIALGAIDGARARGVRIPEDLWVVGYDDIEMASWGAYDLTTVRQPLDEMVGLAVGHLRSRIRGEVFAPVRDCLPNGLVIRGSTARTPMPAEAQCGPRHSGEHA
jgi:LacI family transcriptional regulator